MEHAIGRQITERDRKQAEECVNCSLCRNERQKQNGLPEWFHSTSSSASARTAGDMRRCTAARLTK